MFEVWSSVKLQSCDGKAFYDDQLETSRTDRNAAEQDVDLLKLFGKKAWIVELDP